MIETDSRVYFMPLYYSANPWIMDSKVEHFSTLDRFSHLKYIELLSVKVTAHPDESGTALVLEEVDVFTVVDYMPPYPKTKISQALLMDSISGALAIKADMDICPWDWSIVIYGGQ